MTSNAHGLGGVVVQGVRASHSIPAAFTPPATPTPPRPTSPARSASTGWAAWAKSPGGMINSEAFFVHPGSGDGLAFTAATLAGCASLCQASLCQPMPTCASLCQAWRADPRWGPPTWECNVSEVHPPLVLCGCPPPRARTPNTHHAGLTPLCKRSPLLPLHLPPLPQLLRPQRWSNELGAPAGGHPHPGAPARWRHAGGLSRSSGPQVGGVGWTKSTKLGGNAVVAARRQPRRQASSAPPSLEAVRQQRLVQAAGGWQVGRQGGWVGGVVALC